MSKPAISKAETASKPGRPAFTIDDIDLKQTEEASRRGFALEQIAGLFGMGQETFLRLRRAHPEIDVAIQKGRSEMIWSVGGALLDKAKGGDTVAQIFIMKAYGGAREVHRQEISGPNGGPIETKDVKSKLLGDLLRGDDDDDSASSE